MRSQKSKVTALALPPTTAKAVAANEQHIHSCVFFYVRMRFVRTREVCVSVMAANVMSLNNFTYDFGMRGNWLCLGY